MNRIIIMAKNRHFPKAISMREAIRLHDETTEALTRSNAQSITGIQEQGLHGNFINVEKTTNPLEAWGLGARHDGDCHVTEPTFPKLLADAALAASAQGEA
jgi:hypothetical protein